MAMISNQGIGKILEGVLKYQSQVRGELLPFFRQILDKPAPKSVIVTCVDSRIVASRLLQAEPGDYFLIRSPGNFIPKYECMETSLPSGTPAALELACIHQKANSIAVIGHSDCKTMNILYGMRNNFDELVKKEPNSELKRWLLLNGRDTVKQYLEFEKSHYSKVLTFSEANNNKFEALIDPMDEFEKKDKFSQINTLEQLKNVINYNFLQDKLSRHVLKCYALWLDVNKCDVYLFSFNEKRFVKIDESSYNKLYDECTALENQ